MKICAKCKHHAPPGITPNYECCHLRNRLAQSVSCVTGELEPFNVAPKCCDVNQGQCDLYEEGEVVFLDATIESVRPPSSSVASWLRRFFRF